MDYRKIVWLASYPKSGNTWIRCFLDAYFMGEVDINELLSTVSDDVALWYKLGDGTDPQDLPIEIQQLIRPTALVRLVKHAIENPRPIPLFVKTHTPNLLINGIEMLPANLTKAVIYITRDPHDVLPSFSKHMGTDVDGGLEWMQQKYRILDANKTCVANFIGAWDAHVKSFLNDDCHNAMYVRYEDMLERPVESFTAILKHSGITPDEERVKAALELVELSKLRKQEQEKGFNESSPKAKNQFFGEGGSSKRKFLTPRQTHGIEKNFGAVMKRLGYLKKRVA